LRTTELQYFVFSWSIVRVYRWKGPKFSVSEVLNTDVDIYLNLLLRKLWIIMRGVLTMIHNRLQIICMFTLNRAEFVQVIIEPYEDSSRFVVGGGWGYMVQLPPLVTLPAPHRHFWWLSESSLSYLTCNYTVRFVILHNLPLMTFKSFFYEENKVLKPSLGGRFHIYLP
jgi:hypothetical protein